MYMSAVRKTSDASFFKFVIAIIQRRYNPEKVTEIPETDGSAQGSGISTVVSKQKVFAMECKVNLQL
jgi:hypothetical protein